MKTKIFFILIGILCGTIFSSCSQFEDLDIPEDTVRVENNTRSLLGNFRSTSEWENLDAVTLPSGRTVATPWRRQGAVPTLIPKEIREDIRSRDGWTCLYSGFNDPATPNNLIVFYNRFTGVLKGFYYWEGTAQQNTAFWNISFVNSYKLFYGLDHFTMPLQANNTSTRSTVLNVVDSSVKGFETQSWNCFQTYLTYDPTYVLNNLRMSVGAENTNNVYFYTTGEYSSASNGSIISTSSPSSASPSDIFRNIANGMITQTGETGKEWIQSKIVSGIIRKAGADIIAGGVPAIVSSGINWIFGSFFGKSETTTTTTALQFTTKGSIKASTEGSISTTGIIAPISNIEFNSQERLGNWNLEKQPTIVFDDRAYTSHTTGTAYGLRQFVRKLQIEDVNVVFNDKLKQEFIDKYEVSTRILYYAKFNGDDRWNGDYTASPKFKDLPYYTYILFQDRDDNNSVQNEFWDISYEKIYYDSYDLPIVVSQTSKNYFQIPQYGDPYIPYNEKAGYVVKVTVKIYPKSSMFNPEPIITTKTFLPKQVVRNLPYAGW